MKSKARRVVEKQDQRDRDEKIGDCDGAVGQNVEPKNVKALRRTWSMRHDSLEKKARDPNIHTSDFKSVPQCHAVAN